MFRMAARNIKDNTSESVSEEQIKAVLRRSLDEVLIVLLVVRVVSTLSRFNFSLVCCGYTV